MCSHPRPFSPLCFENGLDRLKMKEPCRVIRLLHSFFSIPFHSFLASLLSAIHIFEAFTVPHPVVYKPPTSPTFLLFPNYTYYLKPPVPSTCCIHLKHSFPYAYSFPFLSTDDSHPSEAFTVPHPVPPLPNTLYTPSLLLPLVVLATYNLL